MRVSDLLDRHANRQSPDAAAEREWELVRFVGPLGNPFSHVQGIPSDCLVARVEYEGGTVDSAITRATGVTGSKIART